MTTFMKSQPNSSRPWKKALLLASVACSLAIPAWANTPVTTPNNLIVVNGTATTTGGGTSNLTVTTTTNNVVLSWTNFWDGTSNGGTSNASDTITYTLPSASSSILNQVTGGLATTINGTISSNGNVYLINPAGVTISGTGVVNTAGFYVSTYLEPLSTFESNGTLAVFQSGSTANANQSGTINIASGASIQTVGGTGNIQFAGKTISINSALAGNVLLVNGGSTVGNIVVGDTGGPATIEGTLTVWGNGGTVNIGGGHAATVEGATTIAANASTQVNLGDGSNAVFQSATTVSSDNGAVTTGTGGQVLAQNNLTINSGTGTTALSVADSTTVQGSLAVSSASTSATGISLAGTAGTTVDGNLTVTESGTGGGIGQGTGEVSANLLNTTSTFSTTTGNVTLGNADLASVAATSTSGNFSLTDSSADAVNLAASNIGTGDFSVSASRITSSGTVTAKDFSATQTSGNLTAPAANVTGNYTLTSSGAINGGSGVTAGAVALNATGAINYSTSGALTLTQAEGTTVNVSTDGNVTLAPATTTSYAGTVTITSTGGNIAETASPTAVLTITSPTTLALDAPMGSVTLGSTTQGDNISALSAVTGSGGLTLYNTGDTGAFTLSNGTNIGGPASIWTGANFNFGAASSDTIAISGNLAVTSVGGINTSAGTLTIGGTVSLTDPTAATIQLGTPTGTDSYGQITVPTTTANVIIDESSTTNLGAITAGTLTVVSSGNIENTSGAIATGAVSLTAGTSGTIQLGTTTTPAAPTGAVTIAGGASANLIIAGQAANVAVSNDALTSLWVDDNATNAIGVTFTGTGSLSQFAFTGGGAVSLTADPVAVTVWNAIDTGTGNVAISDSKAITLGSGINISTTGTTSFTNTGTGAIADTASSPVSIYGPVDFTSGGAINVANNTASSLGGLTFDLTGAVGSNLTYVEGGTANVVGITLPGGSTGTVSISSVSGNIIQQNPFTIPSTAKVKFSAPTGGVTLTQANAISAPISITSYGTATLDNGVATELGNVYIQAGGITIDTAAGSAMGITQATGTSINEYSNLVLTTAGGAITLANAGNNFGNISVDTTNAGGTAAGANVSITENATDHYHAIDTGTAGNFTAKATQGDIIEDPAATVTIGGTTTLTATTGNINWNGDDNNFTNPAVLFYAPGNVTIDSVGSLSIAGTTTTPLTVGGNLTLVATGAGSSITDAAGSDVNVTGWTAFTAGSGGIDVTSAHSNYAGWISFNTSGTVTFSQAGNVTLGASNVSGAASIASTGGTFTNSGTSYFLDTLSIASKGSLVFAAPINVSSGLTVDSTNGPTNLSVDSLSANLNGIAPTNNGNATNYTGPSQ